MKGTRYADEAKEEEDLVEGVDRSFSTIARHQDTTHESVQIKHARHVSTTPQFDHAIEECPVLMAKMQEKKVQPQNPSQNLQMMKVKPHEEDPNVNIVLRSEITTSDDKGKQPEEGGWVCKAPKKETSFNLEHAKETFMEAKKIFTEASTSGNKNKFPDTNAPIEVEPSMLNTFLETFMKLLCDRNVVKGL